MILICNFRSSTALAADCCPPICLVTAQAAQTVGGQNLRLKERQNIQLNFTQSLSSSCESYATPIRLRSEFNTFHRRPTTTPPQTVQGFWYMNMNESPHVAGNCTSCNIVTWGNSNPSWTELEALLTAQPAESCWKELPIHPYLRELANFCMQDFS